MCVKELIRIDCKLLNIIKKLSLVIVVVKSKLETTRFRYCEPIFYATIENSFSLMCERNVGFLISGK